MSNSSGGRDLWLFGCSIARYFKYRATKIFFFFEQGKSWLASRLYQQRGRWIRPFIHSGMAFLIVSGITVGPTLIEENFSNSWREELTPVVLSATTAQDWETSTLISLKPRAEIIEYHVQPGDTVSTIAEKFGVSIDTIRWENDLKSVKDIKPGQVLRILPVSGVRHKVKHGETVYSLAKKYQVDPQVIVDWPYNSFANDETFALAVGQELIIPDGIKPKETPTTPRPAVYAQVPGAGVGSGQFVWPTSGRISQGYAWYHKAIDIANKDAPDILAADGGKVVVAGWVAPTAYGNHIIIDHGNGFATLYAHLSQIYVSQGQNITKGQPIGKMGSTGRSTGTHLHFEVRLNGSAQNPLSYLK